MNKDELYYDATPLTPTQIRAVDLLTQGMTPVQVADKLEVPVAEVREWKHRILFRCKLNQLQNEIVEAGIREHRYFLTILLGPQQTRASVQALEMLEEFEPLPATPKEIMGADFLETEKVNGST